MTTHLKGPIHQSKIRTIHSLSIFTRAILLLYCARLICKQQKQLWVNKITVNFQKIARILEGEEGTETCCKICVQQEKSAEPKGGTHVSTGLKV